MKKETIRIYYNPRCAKCRETSSLVSERGFATELIEYLVTPPSKKELQDILHKLGMRPEQLLRKSEDLFKQHYAGHTLSDAQWIDAMLEHPILIERPIVVRGSKAVVARPPEKVLPLLE